MATAPLGALALYAGLNAFILIWLAVQTGRIRQSEKVFMGDGGNPRLIRVMRGHANAIEFMPMTLLLTRRTMSCGISGSPGRRRD